MARVASFSSTNLSSRETSLNVDLELSLRVSNHAPSGCCLIVPPLTSGLVKDHSPPVALPSLVVGVDSPGRPGRPASENSASGGNAGASGGRLWNDANMVFTSSLLALSPAPIHMNVNSELPS